MVQDGIKATPSLVLGYGDQALADLSDADTPMGTVIRRFDIGDQRARALLAGAGMSVELQGRPISQLSGGQKARLGMLILRLTNPNFYLLDEPTNHLDIDGQEALEGELMAHQASCLVRLARSQFRARRRQSLLADREAAAGRGRQSGGFLRRSRQTELGEGAAGTPAVRLTQRACRCGAVALWA